jgi:hypothetical protein
MGIWSFAMACFSVVLTHGADSVTKYSYRTVTNRNLQSC